MAAGDRSLAWVDRHGTRQALPAPPRSYTGPRLSNDGQRIVVYTAGPSQVWSGDIARAEAVAARIESGNVNINDALATAYASKGSPSGGVKSSGVGARHGDQGLLKYTDAKNVAVLKKQVMGARPGQDYNAYVKQMLQSLKLMRRLGR